MKTEKLFENVKFVLDNDFIRRSNLFDSKTTSALSWLELQPIAWLYSQKVAKGVEWEELPATYFAKIAAGRVIRKEYGCAPICEKALEFHLKGLTPFIPSLDNKAFETAMENLRNRGNFEPTKDEIAAEGKPIKDKLLQEERDRIALAKNNKGEIFTFLQSDIADDAVHILLGDPQNAEKYQKHYDNLSKSIRKTLGDWVKSAYIKMKTEEIVDCVYEDELAKANAIIETMLVIFKELRMNVAEIDKQAVKFNEIKKSINVSELFK